MNLIKKARNAFLKAEKKVGDLLEKAATASAEPVFVIHGDDPVASGVVREWCERGERAGVAKPKILGALEIANQMDHGDAAATFTLRGQDQLASYSLRLWIQRATGRKVDTALIAQAETVAAAMEAWTPKKLPD